MKILFITSTYLGDAILSTGILNHVVQKHPTSKITVVCGDVPAPLFQNLPQLLELIPLKKKKMALHWIFLWWKCFWHRWDWVIDLRGTGISYCLWTQKKSVWKASRDKALKSFQLARFLGLESAPFNKVWLTSDDRSKVESLMPLDATYIALSPKANWHKKEWPLSYFKDLIGELKKHPNIFPNPKFVIFGAPHQRPALDELFSSAYSDDLIDCVGHVTLTQVAACLEKCRIFLGNDSGLMHLAATVGIPTIGLFGPSDPAIYSPWGPRVMAITNHLTVKENFEQVERGQDVMALISVQNVTKNLIHFLK